jgi:PKD repeat protein
MAINSFTADSEISVGQTSAIIDGSTFDGQKYQNTIETDANVYYRVAYSTNTDVSSPSHSAAVGPATAVGFANHWPIGPDITVTSLSTNTTYYYLVQHQVDTTSGSWVDGSGSPGTFVTLTNSSLPVSDFVVSTTTGLAPLQVVFTQSVTGGTPSSVLWDFGDTVTEEWNDLSTPGSAWATRVHNYGVWGTYSPVLTVTNVDGVDTETKTNYINVVSPTVTASFTLATSTFPSSRLVSVVFTDTVTGDNIVADPIIDKLWTVTGNPGKATQTFTNLPIPYTVGTNTTESGKYTVTLSATSLLGVTNSAQIVDAFVVPYLPVVANFDVATPVIVLGNVETFVNLGSGDNLTESWAFGDTSTTNLTTSTVTHSYTTAGTYTPVLTATGSAISTSTTGWVVTTASSTKATATGGVVVLPNTYMNSLGGMLQEVQWHLMGDPEATPCEAFSEFGGADNVLIAYYRRLRSFLKATKLTRTEATLTADTAGIYPLPADFLYLLRVEVDGFSSQPMDEKMADLTNSTWVTATSTGENMGYIIEPEDSLTLRLAPKVTGRTVKIVYVAAPAMPAQPADCVNWDAIPLPYAFSWAVKWGVVADLLSQEGEMNDPIRATFAEGLYQMGVILARQLYKKEFSPEVLS